MLGKKEEPEILKGAPTRKTGILENVGQGRIGQRGYEKKIKSVQSLAQAPKSQDGSGQKQRRGQMR